MNYDFKLLSLLSVVGKDHSLVFNNIFLEALMLPLRTHADTVQSGQQCETWVWWMSAQYGGLETIFVKNIMSKYQRFKISQYIYFFLFPQIV